MKQRMSIVTLGVRDLQKSLDFYEGSLGWKKSKQSSEGIAFFQMHGFVFGLFPWDKLAEDATVEPQGTGFRGITLAYNVDSQKEVDEVIEQVRNLGMEIIKEPQKVFWGGYSGYFTDPDGHLWEVAHNPFWELGKEGSLNLPD